MEFEGGDQMLKVTLYFNEESAEISINSNYDYFLNTVCNIIQIQSEQLKSLSISYIDNEDDNVVLTSQEDYDIFFDQLSENLVKNLKITVKPNSNLDQDECLIHFISYKENSGQNSNIKLNYNNYNNINNNYNNNFINNSNNNFNFNEINNNNNNNNINNSNNYHDINEINEEKNEDQNIDDIVFDYKCSKCEIYPIVCKIFYCDKCSFYLCAECEEKGIKHEHPLLRIDSKEVLMNLKEEENKLIDKKQKEQEKIKGAMRNYMNNNINANNNKYPQFNRMINPLSNIIFRIVGKGRRYYISGLSNFHSQNPSMNNNNNNLHHYYAPHPSYQNYQQYLNFHYN